jgi:S1-C subfamily serine protease
MGFRNGDLIQSVNSVAIKTVADFKGYLLKNKNGGEHHFDIIRNQKQIKLVVNKTLPNVLD